MIDGTLFPIDRVAADRPFYTLGERALFSLPRLGGLVITVGDRPFTGAEELA